MISGIGWLLDSSLMLGLVWFGTDVFVANAIGATTAVSFVFLASQRAVFVARRKRMVRVFMMYLGWHAAMITLASAAIDALSGVIGGCAAWAPAAAPACLAVAVPWIAAGIAKILVTPLTLYSNYVFSSWAIEARASWT